MANHELRPGNELDRVRCGIAAALALSAVSLAVMGCDGGSASGIANPDPTRCIVSGEKLPAKPDIVEVEGKKYALCCKMCEPQLRQDPERFRKNPGSGTMGGPAMPKEGGETLKK